MQKDHGFAAAGTALHNDVFRQRFFYNIILIFLDCADDVGYVLLSALLLKDPQQIRVCDVG